MTRIRNAVTALLASLVLLSMCFAAPAFAASSAKTSVTYGNTAPLVLVQTSKGKAELVQPNGKIIGNAGSASLNFIDVIGRTFDAHWSLTSTVGDIAWVNITVSLDNGGGQFGQDHIGPFISPNAAGDLYWAVGSAGTYHGTLGGDVILDNGDVLDILPAEDTVTVK